MTECIPVQGVPFTSQIRSGLQKSNKNLGFRNYTISFSFLKNDICLWSTEIPEWSLSLPYVIESTNECSLKWTLPTETGKDIKRDEQLIHNLRLRDEKNLISKQK